MGFTLQIGKKTDDDNKTKTAEELLLGVASTLTDLLKDGKNDEKAFKAKLGEAVEIMSAQDLENQLLRATIDADAKHHSDLHREVDRLRDSLVEQEMTHRGQRIEDERIIAQLREALEENGVADPTIEQVAEPAVAAV